MEKYLGEYIDEIFEITEDLSKANLCAVLEGAKNILIRRYPQDFIDWTDGFMNCPHGRQHPHYDVLVQERREAYERLTEINSQANNYLHTDMS